MPPKLYGLGCSVLGMDWVQQGLAVAPLSKSYKSCELLGKCTVLQMLMNGVLFKHESGQAQTEQASVCRMHVCLCIPGLKLYATGSLKT